MENTFRPWPDKASLDEFRAGLSKRARVGVDALKIQHLAELVRRTDRELLKAKKGIGEATVTELRKALRSAGLRFGMTTAMFVGGPLDGQRRIFEGDELPAEYRLPVGTPDQEQFVSYRLGISDSAGPIYKA